MGKPSFRYVSAGECPKCGRLIVRNIEVTLAVCQCESVIPVQLKPTMLFRTNSRLYGKIEKIAGMLNVEVQELMNKTFEVALNDKALMAEAIKRLRGSKR